MSREQLEMVIRKGKGTGAAAVKGTHLVEG